MLRKDTRKEVTIPPAASRRLNDNISGDEESSRRELMEARHREVEKPSPREKTQVEEFETEME